MATGAPPQIRQDQAGLRVRLDDLLDAPDHEVHGLAAIGTGGVDRLQERLRLAVLDHREDDRQPERRGCY